MNLPMQNQTIWCILTILGYFCGIFWNAGFLGTTSKKYFNITENINICLIPLLRLKYNSKVELNLKSTKYML